MLVDEPITSSSKSQVQRAKYTDQSLAEWLQF